MMPLSIVKSTTYNDFPLYLIKVRTHKVVSEIYNSHELCIIDRIPLVLGQLETYHLIVIFLILIRFLNIDQK
jgi:hypothetical protein